MMGTAEKHGTRLLTVQEAAARCRISRSSMYRLIQAGIVPALRVGGAVRVDEAELTEWLYGDGDEAA